MNTLFVKEEFKNYSFIVLGALFLSLAVVGFFLPNQLITGGTAGLALLLHYVTALSIGSLIAIINDSPIISYSTSNAILINFCLL